MQMHSQDPNSIYSEILARIGQQIKFSNYAGQLIQLALRAWFEEEHPLLKQPNPAQLTQLTEKIIERIVADPRVQNEMESRRFVSFGVLLVSLADSTIIVLRDEGFKGEQQKDPKGREQS